MFEVLAHTVVTVFLAVLISRASCQSAAVVDFLDAAFCFGEGGLVASQGGERRELRGAAVQRHLRMRPRDVVRQADDVVVGEDLLRGGYAIWRRTSLSVCDL